MARQRSKAVVSVVIPTCNRATMLRRAIQSVLAQTHSQMEVIVVDDASTDETKEVVRAFKDDRIQYLRHVVRRGAAAARNSGVRSATGDYIAFLDDDDEWEAQKVEMQLASIDGYDAVMCTASMNGRDTTQLRPRPRVDLAILRKRMFPYGGIGVLLARGHVLRDIAFDERLPKYQDWDLVIRIATKYRVAYLNKALVRFNDGGHQRISNQLLHMSAQDMIKKYAVFFTKHRRFFGERWYRFHLAGMLLYGIRHRKARSFHVFQTIRICGAPAVARVLVRRAWQVLSEHVGRRSIFPSAAHKRAAVRAAG